MSSALSFDRARQALRLLSRHKQFSALAIISLGVAIALNTTMYSVLDTMISPRVAMHEPERLYGFVYYGDFRRPQLIPQREKARAYREDLTFHDGVIAFAPSFNDRVLERGNDVREGRVLTVSPNYFQVLGVVPKAGRLLSPVDLGADTRPVVLSERMWRQLFSDQRRFEPAPLTVGDAPRLVVGVLPYEADFPGANTDVWQLPLPDAAETLTPQVARLKPGVTPEQAATELEVLNRRFKQVTGEGRDAGFVMKPATRQPFRVHQFHYALVGSVFAVLLIACANLANLQLARGVSRARELATRAAVGASRRDIIVQLLIESAWLALGGLILGAVLTAWGMKLVDSYVPRIVQEYVTHPQLSWRVMIFAVLATFFALMLVGLAPAIRLSRVDIEQVLKSGAGTGKTRSTRRQYGALVVVEVALAIAVLCSASLLMRVALQIMAWDPGHDHKGLAAAWLVVSNTPGETRTRQQVYQTALAAARHLKGVTDAAVTRGNAPKQRAVSVALGDITTHHDARGWYYTEVTPDYLRTLRRPIVAGRDFSVNEFAEPSAIIDRHTARLLFPGLDPIGRLIKLDSAHSAQPWIKVIGVVGMARDRFYTTDYERAEAAKPKLREVFVLIGNDTTKLAGRAIDSRRRYSEVFEVIIRSTENPIKIPLQLRRELHAGPNSRVSYASMFEQMSGITALRAKHVFMAWLFMLFGLTGLALAALGVYAIIAHMVAQRTREFGVRLAIGAAVSDIRAMVVREGNVLTLAGIAVGLLVTAMTAGFVRAFVFDEWDRYDSRVYAVVCLTLFAVAWLASYIPARRAMRINPVEALRND